jgi:hypothetical protein
MNISIDDFKRQSLIEYAKSKTCIVGGIGTGNLVLVNDKFYIVTCQHVAETFFKNNRSVVTLYSNRKLKQSELKYISNSELFDIALIEILVQNGNEQFYELTDFIFIDDFTKYNFEQSDIHLLGFPFEFRIEDNLSTTRYWFSYLSIPMLNKTQKDFLYCDYPLNKNSTYFESNYNTKLPSAPGLSGSFVHIISSPNFKEEEIWSIKFVKVVAMQVAWDKKSFLKCVNINQLNNLFSQIPV